MWRKSKSEDWKANKGSSLCRWSGDLESKKAEHSLQEDKLALTNSQQKKQGLQSCTYKKLNWTNTLDELGNASFPSMS